MLTAQRSVVGQVHSRSQAGPRAGTALRPCCRNEHMLRPAFPRQHQQRRGAVVAHGLFGLGLPELAVIAGVAALVFGPSKLPELGKGLGQTVKSFQTAAKEFEQELKAATADKPEDAASAASTAAAVSSTEEVKKDAAKEIKKDSSTL